MGQTRLSRKRRGKVKGIITFEVKYSFDRYVSEKDNIEAENQIKERFEYEMRLQSGPIGIYIEEIKTSPHCSHNREDFVNTKVVKIKTHRYPAV